MERITKSDLIDKFIEFSALTPSDVMGGAGYRVGGVGKRDFCCFFFSVIIAFVCCDALGRFRANLETIWLFHWINFIEARKPLLTYHFDSFKPLLTYQLLF